MSDSVDFRRLLESWPYDPEHRLICNQILWRLFHFSKGIRVDRSTSGWQRRFFRFMKPNTFQGLSIPLERCKFIAYDNAWF
jgi:hypothetical protein